jgi:hypothetical protein
MFREEPIRMKTYKIVVEPKPYFTLPGSGSALTEDVLTEALAGVVVRELSDEDQLGHRTIHVQLQRPTDAQALNELVSLAERLGFKVIEAKVSEWVDEATERAILGLFGGGLVGGVAENTVVAITGALAGAIVGLITGAAVEKLKAEYQARRDYQGNWSFQQIDRRPPSAPGFQPGFSPA